MSTPPSNEGQSSTPPLFVADPQAYAPQPAPFPRRSNWGIKALAAIVAVLAVALAAVCGAAVEKYRRDHATTAAGPPASAALPVPSSPARPAPGVPLTTFGDGTWRVGVDIAPGTYRSGGADGHPGGCLWDRLSNLSGRGEPQSLGGDEIAQDLMQSGPAVVTIAPTDAAFKSDGCGRWTKVG